MPASGAPVTFAFAGVIETVVDPDGLLQDTVSPNFTFQGRYTFESTAVDVSPPGNEALYLSPSGQGYGLEARVLRFSPFSPIVVIGDVLFIQVSDNPGDLNDTYSASVPAASSNLPVPPGSVVTAGIVLRGPAALDGLELPLVPPDLARFPVIQGFDIHAFPPAGGASLLSLYGRVLHLELPEPAFTVPVALAALGALRAARTRRARQSPTRRD